MLVLTIGTQVASFVPFVHTNINRHESLHSIFEYNNEFIDARKIHKSNTILFNSESNEDAELSTQNDDDGEEIKSAALEWAKQQNLENMKEENIVSEDVKIKKDEKKKYVVIGGGWGGWGAAKTLCQSNCNADVTLIDALPDPTGVSYFFFFKNN